MRDEMEQEHAYQEFDRKVKSLLENAVESVPEGSWEAISARLAAGAAGTETAAGAASGAGTAQRIRIRTWMRRTGYAVTAVAAALLLFFLLWDKPARSEKETPALAKEEGLEVRTPKLQTGTPGLEASEPHLEAGTPDKSIARAITPRPSTEKTKPVSTSTSPTDEPTIAPTAGQTGFLASSAGNTSGIVPTSSTEETATIPAPSVDETSTIVVSTEQMPDTTSSARTEAEPIPYNWDELDEEPEIKPLKKHQPTGFHLAAYSNALSNFTNNNGGQSRHSATHGSNLPDHSYFSEMGESYYDIPLTFGLNFTFDIGSHLSLGIGANYTRLSRHFSGTYYQLQDDGTFDNGTDYDNVYNIQQFLGIPLTVYFHFLRTKRINLYIHAGGTVEKCLANTWTANQRAINYNEPVKGVQWSAGGGLGVDFMLASFLSLYLDPNIRYYFSQNQPKSIRTKQPLMLGFEAGVRFHL